MEYIINPLKWNTSFAVPAEVVDKYLRLAGSVQLKVLLWLMRHSADEKTIDDMAKEIGVSAADCTDALTFWTETGVLIKNGNINEIKIAEEKTVFSEEIVVPEKNVEIKKTIEEIEYIKPSREQIYTRSEESAEIKFLFQEAQMRMGRTLGDRGQAILLMMHDDYGLPVEVIVTIIEYCTSIGKISNDYLLKIAKDWSSKEIDTLEKADEKINELKTADRMWNEFCLRTGVSNPRPTSVQRKYLNRWKNEYNFSMDMIHLAYEETADNIQKLSFQYMDKILVSWFNDGLKTPADVERAKQERKNQVSSVKNVSSKKRQTSYDIDEFMKQNEQKELVYKRKGGND